jgi:hypothetical protein
MTMGIEKTRVDLADSIMLIDTTTQHFDMQAIENRRFMFNPDTGSLVLGKYTPGNISYSHAEELGKSGVKEPYDDFIRGWVGTNAREYKDGVIHFAPHIDGENIAYFNKGFDTLLMFRENNANGNTVVRGFGKDWEQPLSKALDASSCHAVRKPSVLGQLKAERPQEARPPKATRHDKEI